MIRAPRLHRARRHRSALTRRSSRRPRRGASLVELIVAMLLLSVGLFSVLGTSSSVSDSLAGGMRQTLAASIAQSRMDSLTSVGCQSLTSGGGTSSGSDTVRGIEESWSVEDGRNVKTIRVNVSLRGRTMPIRYETIIPCRD